MALELSREFLILCEGLADQNFLRKLADKRHIFPEFDLLDSRHYHGVTNFDIMLKAVRGDRHGFPRLKGVLIVADSGDDPKRTFRSIQNQIRSAGGYPIPGGLSTLAPRTADHPATFVTLLPNDSTPGALETLCVQDLLDRHPWLGECLDAFLRCEQIVAFSWPAEKLAKARFQCIVAALNRDDPSKALSYAFADDPSIVDLNSTCFDEVTERIGSFFSALR